MSAAQINAFGGTDVLGSIFGHLYLSGGNLAECFIGGRIAGLEILRSTG
jgi:hypothetical protein